VCGDGSVGYPEECDDGNTVSGDGCSATCELEPGYACSPNQPCHVVVCGDGSEDSYLNSDGVWTYELCDDGNAVSGDGCSATCVPEVGYSCFDPGLPCKKVVCGDGSIDEYVSEVTTGSGGSAGGPGIPRSGSAGFAGSGTSGPAIGYAIEQCDDGNAVSGDGCSATCQIEPGYSCDAAGSPCRMPRCGDGHIDFIAGAAGSGSSFGAGGMFGAAGGGSYGYVEACDDGNLDAGDGCSATCTLESGYSCPVPGQPCKLAVCGDGIVDWPVESCDDGNLVPGDGCNEHCQWEYGGAGFGGSAGSFGVSAGSPSVITAAGAGGRGFGAGGAH
jgi:cysteine-rich repeat protein